MSTHTPGPWFTRHNAKSASVGTADGRSVAKVSAEADARLIAAAPELLAALKLADTILDGFPLYATGHGGKTIRAAIAKAEGTK